MQPQKYICFNFKEHEDRKVDTLKPFLSDFV